ncbi:hypothetical protein GUITHDRAFT_149286, partial [Guillardia theta CCMP2712]
MEGSQEDADMEENVVARTKAAALFEQEELVFRASNPDIFAREREQFPVMEMLAIIVQNESMLRQINESGCLAILTMLAALCSQPLNNVETLFCKQQRQAAPGLSCLPSLQQSLFMELLTQDSMEEKLSQWVASEELPMCSYGAGLLSLALLDDQEYQCADEIVRKGLVPNMFKRLSGEAEREAGVCQDNALGTAIRLMERSDKILCHETLRMLAALLFHRKFALVFVEHDGLQRLLELPEMSYYAGSTALCLLNLVHFRGVIDKLCAHPRPTSKQLVQFLLQLVEYRDEVATSNVLQSFAKVLAYEHAFLKPFDELGGPLESCRCLMNVVRICLENTGEGRQRVKGGGKSVAKWCGLALRNFVRAHLLVAAEHLERVEADGDAAAREAKPSNKANHALRPNKAVSPDDEEQVAKACILLERRTRIQEGRWSEDRRRRRRRRGRFVDPADWAAAVQEVAGNGGLELLLQLLQFAAQTRLCELAAYILQTMQITCLLPMIRMDLMETSLDSEDGDVMSSALHAICTCVGCSAPPFTGRALHQHVHSMDGNRALTTWGSLHWDSNGPNATCRRVWKSLQDCDGIRVLSALLRGNSEYTSHDRIRALACRALTGLSYEPRIQQILQESQLALALSELLKQSASYLISCITGRAQHTVLDVAGDSALRKIEKAATVEQATISYDNRELLRLVQAHLVSSGLHKAA